MVCVCVRVGKRIRTDDARRLRILITPVLFFYTLTGAGMLQDRAQSTEGSHPTGDAMQNEINY